jgi:signal transduction histidine kinase
LGLSKKLVEGQGGSVSVKVNLVRGSAFSFILPLVNKSKMEEEVILLDPVSEIKTCGY